MSDEESSVGSNIPADPPTPPNESPLERQLRLTLLAVENLTRAVGVTTPQSLPVRSLPTVESLVRSSTEPTVVKSLNDLNYTKLEKGWIGDDFTCPEVDSRSENKGLEGIDPLPENTEDEIRFKARQLTSFHRERGTKLIFAEQQIPEGSFIPTPSQLSAKEQIFRIPQSPRKAVTHSDYQRREQSALQSLSGRCWDPRWSWSYNVDQLMLILSTSFKDVIKKYRSYDSYLRGSNAHYYLVEHFRIQAWRNATLVPNSTFVIPYCPIIAATGAARYSAMKMTGVNKETYISYHSANDESKHQEFDPTKDLSESVIRMIALRHGDEVSSMVVKDRSHILPQFRDEGYVRIEYTSSLKKDEHKDGSEYKKINPTFERTAVLSEIEFKMLSKTLGNIALSFTEQRGKHRRELRVYHELHALDQDISDNFFYDILHTMKLRLKESHTKTLTVLETMFDDMMQRYDATAHRISHLIQGLLDVNEKILVYGDESHQRAEGDLHKALLLKLRVWYRSVPKHEETPLSDDWSKFVTQLRLLGTRNESKIDDQYRALRWMICMLCCNYPLTWRLITRIRFTFRINHPYSLQWSMLV